MQFLTFRAGAFCNAVCRPACGLQRRLSVQSGLDNVVYDGNHLRLHRFLGELDKLEHSDKQLRDGAAELILNRPGRRNALSREVITELRAALKALEATTSRVLLVRSAVPGIFCAGADLKERATLSEEEARTFVTSIRDVFTYLASGVPSIAVIEGAALGGGAELALACDLRVATASAEIGFPETRLGIIPGAGGTQRLPRLIGLSTAKRLLFTGERVSATKAHDIGLVDVLVPDGNALQEGRKLAKRLLDVGPLGLKFAKEAIDGGMQMELDKALELETKVYSKTFGTFDRAEGIKSFLEKRPPKYRGV